MQQPTLDFDRTWSQAKQLAPPDHFETVEHGWEQHVLIDHQMGLVYRYPRNANAAAKLQDEIKLLQSLNEQNWPVQIPVMIEHTAEYSVYKFIEGDVLSPEVIAVITDEQMKQIGTLLGIFLAQLHRTSHQVVEQKITKQTISLFEYYSSRIKRGKESEYFKEASDALDKLGEPDPKNQVVVHGDLHGLNMVIDPLSRKLVGVIDFSEVEVGDPHQDFRKLFMADERLLLPSLQSYENKGGAKLSEEKVRLWAYVNEWANICYFDNNKDNATYQRAMKHLKKWCQIA